MGELTMSPKAEALRDLDGIECPHCGLPKDRGKSFCRRCYFSLPEDLKRGLYMAMSEGYTETYMEARDYLREETAERASRRMSVSGKRKRKF